MENNSIKSSMIQKSNAKFSHGFFWMFLCGLFLLVTLNLTVSGYTFDILPDIVGSIFGIIGVFYFFLNRKVLDKKYSYVILLLAICVIIGFTNSLIMLFPNTEITNVVFLWILVFSMPISLISTSMIGYNFSKKHLPILEKNWKILSMGTIIIFIFTFAVQLLPYLVTLKSGNNLNLEFPYTAIVLAFMVIIGIYSFRTIWKTYSLSK